MQAFESPRPLRLAVVGLGRWGRNVLRDFGSCPEVRVVGLCDQRSEQLEAAASRFPAARIYPDMNELLELCSAEAVAVCTPAETHADLVIQALESGRHVFVEKPLALSHRDALRLVQLARARQRVLAVGHQLLHYWPVAWLAAVLESGVLGAVYRVDMQRHNCGPGTVGVGPWWDLAPHDLSVLTHLFGAQVRLLSMSPEPGDGAAAHLLCDDEVEVVISCRLAAVERRRRVLIEGSGGLAVWDESSGSPQLELQQRTGRGRLRSVEPTSLPGLRAFKGLLAAPQAVPQPLKLQCQEFVTCALDGAEPYGSGRRALEIVRLLEQGQQLQISGRQPLMAGSQALPKGQRPRLI